MIICFGFRQHETIFSILIFLFNLDIFFHIIFLQSIPHNDSYLLPPLITCPKYFIFRLLIISKTILSISCYVCYICNPENILHLQYIDTSHAFGQLIIINRKRVKWVIASKSYNITNWYQFLVNHFLNFLNLTFYLQVTSSFFLKSFKRFYIFFYLLLPDSNVI